MMRATEGELTVGDEVETATFKLRYRVVRLRGDRVVCAPLSQPHWDAHFMFPRAYVTRVEAPPPGVAPLALAVPWWRVPWSIWAHTEGAPGMTACGRGLGAITCAVDDPVARQGERCALCLAASERRACEAPA